MSLRERRWGEEIKVGEEREEGRREEVRMGLEWYCISRESEESESIPFLGNLLGSVGRLKGGGRGRRVSYVQFGGIV